MKKWVRNTLAAGGAAGIVAVAAGVGVGISSAPAAQIATGYYAEAACGTEYIRGATNGQPDIPEHPMAGWITPERNIGEHFTEASILGLYSKRAYYVPNSGCVVADSRPEYSAAVPDVPVRAEQAGALGGGVPQPTAPPADPAREKALDSAISDALMVEGARAVVVMQDGALVAEDYTEGFDATTPQLGWSMTKSLANLLAGRVAKEDPSFRIDDANLRPEWEDAGDERAEITVDQLMRMTSGLEWYENYDTEGDTGQMLYREPDMAAYVADKPLEHAPGTFEEYSTGTTTLLCDVLQEKSGMGIDMAWELLFKPLGMVSAQLSPDESGTLACGSYAWATPRDWAKMGQFVANGGEVNGQKLLPEGWMKASTTATRAADGEEFTREDPNAPAYGAGWWLNKDADGALRFPDLPEDMFWASGHDGQFTVVVPSRNVVVVRQGFSPDLTVEGSGALDVVRAALG